MGRKKIALVVEGLWEVSDSIGYDCVGEFEELTRVLGATHDVRIFANVVADQNYPDVPVENIRRLEAWLGRDRDATVIYHWCDGWDYFDNLVKLLPAKVIIRWHNNTPPWFFAPYSMGPTIRTTTGYSKILDFLRLTHLSYWVNSVYTANQLIALGGDRKNIHVVYPISPYLSSPQGGPVGAEGNRDGGALKLLFVSRVVPHKGHKHVVVAAAAAQRLWGKGKVEVLMPGRPDPVMPRYASEVRTLAQALGVEVELPGEVTHAALRKMYRQSDVFVCLSEHEGFGLPIFEAMRVGMPVVGLRSTAIGEFLASHPLGVDRLDYDLIARRVLAAVEPAARSAVVEWQETNVSANYSRERVSRQMAEGLTGKHSMPDFGARADHAVETLVARALERLPSGPAPPSGAAASWPAADTVNRMVSRYDIEAYKALTDIRQGVAGSLYETVWRTGMPPKRKLFSRLLRLIRKMALSLNFGTVAAVERSQLDIRQDIDRLHGQINDLQFVLKERLHRTEKDLPARRRRSDSA